MRDGVLLATASFMQLKPNEKPEALFCINATEISAREYCNLHGLWKS